MTFVAGDRAKAEARFGEETHQPFVESHCWEGPPEDGITRIRCVDKVEPTAGDLRPLLEVPQGAELVVVGTAKSVECSVASLPSPLDTIARIEMTDGRAVLDRKPGEYAVGCRVTRPQGQVPFLFGIEMVPRAD